MSCHEGIFLLTTISLFLVMALRFHQNKVLLHSPG
jgi:hypothetical protein